MQSKGQARGSDRTAVTEGPEHDVDEGGALATEEEDSLPDKGDTSGYGARRWRSDRNTRPQRRVPWYIGLPVTLAVIFALFLGMLKLDLLPGLPDIFGTVTKDRSGPVLLKSIQDMSHYQAASGDFQVIVDLEQDAKFLPDAIRGNRTLYVGAGVVGAYVDLGKVAKDGVKVSDDRLSAVLTLPPAQLDQATLDVKRSYVFQKERGFFDRIGDFFGSNPGDQQKIQELALQKIQDAAKSADLNKRAQDNTRNMLQGLLRSLGFTSVEVNFLPAA